MKYETAIKLKEAHFPQYSSLYGTCPHMDSDVITPGECGCDIMYKIVSNPTVNEILEACCPEFESISFAPGPTNKDNVWVVAGKIGRKRRLIHAQHADEALALFWLVKYRYQLKTKPHVTKPTQTPASTDTQGA